MVALPDGFCFKNGILSLEGVLLTEIASSYGTPIYCYSASAIKKNYLEFSSGLPDTTICYALKANDNIHIIQMLSDLGSGADVVSGGELNLALLCGIPPEKIVFSGVGKQDWEITRAIRESVQINVESLQELTVVSDIATAINKKAIVALRFNPDVNAVTNAKITTGLKENKFGLSEKQVFQAIGMKCNMVNIIGLSVHIGSQIMDLNVFRLMAERVFQIVADLEEKGLSIQVVDMGGGLGVNITGETRVPTISSYTNMMHECTSHFRGRIMFEPGRAIVADAGVVLSRVLFTKESEAGFTNIIIDAGMNDFVRSAMYDVKADIIHVQESGGEKVIQSINGPVCESGDCFNSAALIERCSRGDLVVICAAGAYGSSMSSTYNARPLIRELMVSNGSVTPMI